MKALTSGKIESGPVNPILELLRQEGATDAAWELLFQLGRVWSEWQSPRIGTFPLANYRDPFGPVSRASSVETGEDYLYWELIDLSVGYQTSPELERYWEDSIVHATRVLDRYTDIFDIN